MPEVMKPMEDPVTLEGLAAKIDELHSCVHVGNEATQKLTKEVTLHKRSTTRSLRGLGMRITKVEKNQAAANQRLGVKKDVEQQKTAWFPTPSQLLFGITALIVLYRVLAPLLEPVVATLHKTLMTVAI